jgi:hypothetical protein
MSAKKKRVVTTPGPTGKKKAPAKPAAAPTREIKSPPASASASVPVAKKYSALDAAAQVLRESGQPLSCPKLIQQMAARGYWSSPKGKTPSATLYAALMREVKGKGEAARFVKTGPGKFALRAASSSSR